MARPRRRRRARPRPRDPRATRQALKAAGTELFARRGFNGATAELLAARAGVNKAMINYHFGGKRGLYTAIVVESFSELVGRLQALARSSAPAPELLREVVGVFAETVSRFPNLPAMLLREVLSGGEHLDRQAFLQLVSVMEGVRALVERGIREGSLRRVDPLLTHLSLVGSIVFFFATDEFRRRAMAELPLPFAPPDARAYVRHVQDLMARGLVADAARAPRRRSR